MSDLMNEIYLDIGNVSKYKIMVSRYTGMTDNILKELRGQPYNLKIEQQVYSEDLNKVKYSFTVTWLKEPIKGYYLISNKLAFNSKIGNLLAKVHFNNLLSRNLTNKLQEIRNDIVLKSKTEYIYSLDIMLDLVKEPHVREYVPPSDDWSIYMAIIHQMAFLQEFDTSNLIDLYKVAGYKNTIPMVRIDDINHRPPKLLYNLDKDEIERVFPGTYVTIYLKDGKSNHEINLYLTSTEFSSGAYKNIQVKKGYIEAKNSIKFKYTD